MDHAYVTITCVRKGCRTLFTYHAVPANVRGAVNQSVASLSLDFEDCVSWASTLKFSLKLIAIIDVFDALLPSLTVVLL